MQLKLSALILLLLEIILVLLLVVRHRLTGLHPRITLQPVTTLQGVTAGNQLAGIKEIVVFLNSASFMRKEIASH